MNVNDYVCQVSCSLNSLTQNLALTQSLNYEILQTKTNSLWASEKIFMNANRMGALKLPKGQNSSLFFCFSGGDAVNKIPACGVAMISNLSVCDVFHATVFGAVVSCLTFLKPNFVNPF